MRRLVNSWSPLTHASHCMTTSRPAADIQMTERVTPAMHPRCFYAGCRSGRNPPYFRAWDQLRIRWLGQCQSTSNDRNHNITLDSVSRLAMTLRMFDSSTSVKSPVSGAGAAACFTADTGGCGGRGGDGVGMAGDSFGGRSTVCVTG